MKCTTCGKVRATAPRTTTPAQSSAARSNGKLGGRPRKTPPPRPADPTFIAVI
jgi:hypothetical protein